MGHKNDGRLLLDFKRDASDSKYSRKSGKRVCGRTTRTNGKK